jgi:hypothetical protein
VRKSGTVVEYREYRGVGHGFGLGVGTSAEGRDFRRHSVLEEVDAFDAERVAEQNPPFPLHS